MFSGIVETLAKVEKIEKDGTNIHFTLSSAITDTLKIDQSISHNGVCLTVVNISGNTYTVTAIEETLIKTNLGILEVGSIVNLEKAMKMDALLDGHIVQGHVDTTATVTEIDKKEGSTYFTFNYDPSMLEYQTVDKGSISVNGVSLTVVNSKKGQFQVAIIPYTIENTNFKHFEIGTVVNLEFDILGKYILKYMQNLQQ